MLPPYPTAPEAARGWRTEKARHRELAVRMEGVMAAREKKKRRVSLSAHTDEIRAWVEEGYTDAWIASFLGTSTSSVQSFRSRHGIYRPGPGGKDRRQRGEEYALFEGVLEHPPPTKKRKKRPKGIWLDPAIADTQSWARRWRSVREVEVKIGEDSIIIEAAKGRR